LGEEAVGKAEPVAGPQRIKYDGEYLRRLCAKGVLVRVGRDLYVPAEAGLSAHTGFAQAAKRVPQGVVCLLSALRFHEIGTANPFEVWIALGRDVRRPKVEYPPLRILRFSGQALTEGVERHRIESVQVQVYNPAKTVADCFKYRHKIGLEPFATACGPKSARRNSSGAMPRSAA
jgi:predicted transcriptional regulator of viral defense system